MTRSGSSLTRAARSSSRTGTPWGRRSASSKPAPVTAATTARTGRRRAGGGCGRPRPRRGRRGRGPEVPHAVRREQRADRGLGALDAGQPVRGDLDAVGHPAGQAGGGGLVPRRQLPAAGGLADLGLGQPGVAQRRDRPALGGGADAGPEAGDRVVGVGAGGDRADARALPRAGSSTSSSSALQKKQRSPPLAR